MRSYILLFASFAIGASSARAQRCPEHSDKGSDMPSEVRTLEGTLIYHDSIRQWFELKFDQPQCGQTSTELVKVDNWVALEVLRGCRVRSKGAIAFSPTGYYSLDTFQGVNEIEPVGRCTRKPAFPDYSSAKPDKSVQSYRVEMRIEYGRGDHPVQFHVSSEGKEVRPWQAYASYYLTGGFVLYGHCAEGFVIDKVFGTPQAQPSHFEEPRTPEDMAMFDPEGATAAGIRDLRLGYTCLRKP